MKSKKHYDRREILKYGIAGGISLSFGLSGCGQKAVPTGPNIILITVDTLRADHLGCYGYERETSPNIDKFATEAMLYEKCLSHAPVTSSSFASILSGFLPHETGVFANLPLPEDVTTLPEILNDNGYKTAAVVSNYALRRNKGWKKGFNVYDDKLDSVESIRNQPERIAANTTSRAIELLKKYQGKPLFLWVHYQDPHGTYTPPKEYQNSFDISGTEPKTLSANDNSSGIGGIPSYQLLGENRDFHHYVAQYDAEIRYMDNEFKRLTDAVKAQGFYDNSLIAFTADHGEGMGERDYYFAHGANLYNNLIHVPLIVRYGQDMIGREKTFVQHMDIVPTALKAANISPSLPYRGKDLFDKSGEPRVIVSEMKLSARDKTLTQDEIEKLKSLGYVQGKANDNSKDFIVSAVSNGFKLIYRLDKDTYELYDLNSDFAEEHNVIDEQKYQKQIAELKIHTDKALKQYMQNLAK